MAVISDMILEYGGRIQDCSKLARSNGEATLIIGLGKTGSDALMNIKREIYSQIKPESGDFESSRYDSIKFLAVDSDFGAVKHKNHGAIYDLDLSSEILDILVKNVLSDKETMSQRTDMSWFDYNALFRDVSNLNISTRTLGRFELVYNAELFYKKVKSALEDAIERSDNEKVNVHILSCVGESTGSGILLDVCYLVRKVLEDIKKNNVTISGYFFMPDVILKKPEAFSDSVFSHYVNEYSYAALQEIDYCMNFGINGGSFKMQYSFAAIDSNKPPVDNAYLISATGNTGNMIQNAYEHAIDVATTHIINALIKTDCVESEAEETLCHKEHLGGNHYSVLGAFSLGISYNEILSYFCSKMLEKVKIDFCNALDENAETFMQKNGLSYDEIFNKLVSGIEIRELSDSFDLKHLDIAGFDTFEKEAEEMILQDAKLLEQNAVKLTEGLSEYKFDFENASLIKDIISVTDQYIAKCNESLELEERRENSLKQGTSSAKSKLEKTHFIGRGKLLIRYKKALQAYYTHCFRIKVMTCLKKVLEGYKHTLNSLYENCFGPLNNVLKLLKETFKKNIVYTSSNRMSYLMSEKKLFELDDIKAILDEIYINTGDEDHLHSFMSSLYNNSDVLKDDSKIYGFVCNFINKEFDEVMSHSFDALLGQFFNCRMPNELSESVKGSLIKKNVWQWSTPLCWIDSEYNGSVDEYVEIDIPDGGNASVMAVEQLLSENGCKAAIRKSGPKDRITVLRKTTALPLCAFNILKECERTYMNSTNPVGRHIYETEPLNWNLTLAPIFPSKQ